MHPLFNSEQGLRLRTSSPLSIFTFLLNDHSVAPQTSHLASAYSPGPSGTSPGLTSCTASTQCLLATRDAQTHPATYLISKKMTETPEKVVEEQVNPEQVEAQRVAEAEPGPDSEVPSTESSSSRPMTRSQTGRATKRRNPEEAATESKKRTTPSTKKQKTVSRQASASAENVDAPAPAENASTSNPTPPPPPPIAPPPVVEEPMPPSTSRITFLEVSTAADAQGERRISRSRAVFPVPVPNLTKKSRGRRVPTSEAMEATPAAQPEKRVYICKADGCGKCFHRGEHLKRHIRSIHTHEKPFKCSFPSCGKFFNRHDNLLQHLKVHKDTKAPRNQKTSTPNASQAGTPPPGPQSQLPEPESPTSEAPDSPVVPRPRTIYDHQPNLYAGYVNTGPFESPAESLRFQVTNMAVSSLRTEIPQSPTEPHQPPPFPWHHPEAMQDQLTY